MSAYDRYEKPYITRNLEEVRNTYISILSDTLLDDDATEFFEFYLEAIDRLIEKTEDIWND